MPPRNRVSELIHELRARGQHSPEEREHALAQLDPSTLSVDEAKDWYESWGLAASERADVGTAIQRFEEGLARFPDHSSLPTLLRQERARNRVDAALQRSVRSAGQYVPEEVEQALLEARAQSLSADELSAWHQAYSAAAMQRGDRAAALQRYQAGLAEFPNDARLRFGLGQELEAAGNVDAACAEFAQTRYPAVPAEYALVIAQYAFLWNRPEAGVTALAPVVRGMLASSVLDTHFLYARGLPSARRLLGFATGLSAQAGNHRLQQLSALIKPHLARLREEADALTDLEIEVALTRQAAPLLAALEQRTQSATGTQSEYELQLLAWRMLERPTSALREEWSRRATGPLRWAVEAAAAQRRGDAPARDEALEQIPVEQFVALQVSGVVAHGLLPYWDVLRQPYVAARQRAH